MNSDAAASSTKIEAVILDLDGTLLDTESLLHEIGAVIVEGYGKTWDNRGNEARLGKMPLEAAQALIDDYDLPCRAEDLLSQVIDGLRDRWEMSKALPGADRFISHLHKHGVPMAIASNTPQRFITTKLHNYSDWVEAMTCVIGGDEVRHGKPAPDIYLEAAKRLQKDPALCLVVEDSPAGVEAAKAAGMQAIAVPSLPKKSSRPLYAAADVVLSSLLDFNPELWGLPPFNDRICDALPIAPWHMAGPVIKGFGRGSKVLGIPTANLPTTAFADKLAGHVCGIYLGWAGLRGHVYKMVMSVGWNPYFDNKEKTVEPWLLHTFEDDFYDEELRLVVVGYIRPEADFPSLEALVERIREDGRVAEAALGCDPYKEYAQDPFLSPQT